MENSIRWQAPEFTYHEKSGDWFWILGIVSIAGVVISIIVGNILFAILIVIGSIAVGVYAKKKPETISFEIYNKGIRVHKILYPYSNLESFWVSEPEHAPPKLLLTSKKTLALQIVIPLRVVDPEDVREYLSHYLPEEEQEESLIEQVTDLVRF